MTSETNNTSHHSELCATNPRLPIKNNETFINQYLGLINFLLPKLNATGKQKHLNFKLALSE